MAGEDEATAYWEANQEMERDRTLIASMVSLDLLLPETSPTFNLAGI